MLLCIFIQSPSVLVAMPNFTTNTACWLRGRLSITLPMFFVVVVVVLLMFFFFLFSSLSFPFCVLFRRHLVWEFIFPTYHIHIVVRKTP
jgi:hypothetical protein